jgi:hypothetical protein
MGDGVMPKEIVYDDAGMYDAVVGWEPDGYVQVGIKSHNATTIRIRVGDEEVDKVEFTGRTAGFDSLWGTFDRAGINRLIKALKHARDAAYGRDE